MSLEEHHGLLVAQKMLPARDLPADGAAGAGSREGTASTTTGRLRPCRWNLVSNSVDVLETKI